MSSSVYDPRKFEFVARMGRIPGPAKKTKEEKIPVTFRIPDPPEQELVSIPLGRSMRAEPFGGHVDNKPPNLDDFLQDLPKHECSERHLSNDEKEKKNAQLEKMIKAREKRQTERKLQQDAQHLVNEALLQNELKELKKRDEMLQDITRTLNSRSGSRSVDMRNATIFQEPQPQPNEELMKYIRRELERLVPIVKEDGD